MCTVCVCVCILLMLPHSWQSWQQGFWRVKVQTVISFLLSVSTALIFSYNHRNLVYPTPQPVSFSVSHPHSVFLIGVQHPPTSCQERAPSWSSEPGNYCLAKLMPRRPSQTSRTSQRAPPRLPGDREGKAGQTLQWSHPTPSTPISSASHSLQ